jgi:hypothetical protein
VRGFEVLRVVRRRVVFVAAAVVALLVERDDGLAFGRPLVAGSGAAAGFAEPEVLEDVAGLVDPAAVAFDAPLRLLRVVVFAAGAACLAVAVDLDAVLVLLVEPEAAGFVVDRRVAGFVARAVAAFAVVPAFAVVAAFAVAGVLARLREPGGRPRRRGVALVSVAGGVRCRIGVTTWVACTAAEPTVRAAPPTAPPTASAAEDAAETALDAAAAAREATREASPATSDSDSATCFRRFATSLRPFVATAVASWRTRLLSVLRAAASCFSSLRSSLAALFDSGLTAPLASTMTSATVSTTTSRRPLLPPSSRFAIDRPPAVPRRARPSRARLGPMDRTDCDRRQVCHARATTSRSGAMRWGAVGSEALRVVNRGPTSGYPMASSIGPMTAPTAGQPDRSPNAPADRLSLRPARQRRTPVCHPGSIVIGVEERAAQRTNGELPDDGIVETAMPAIDVGLPEDLVLAGLETRLPVAESMILDLLAHELRRDGRTIPLRPKEYQLLATLAANPGRAFSRRQLLDLAWDRDRDIATRTVDVHVHWLRAKIEAIPRHPTHLITVRGFGYRLDPWPDGSR